jgi:hypothetical protein
MVLAKDWRPNPWNDVHVNPDEAEIIRFMKILLWAQAVLLICLPQARGADYVDICSDAGAGKYEAFPRICRLKDGRLMCSFMAGYGHVSIGKTQLQQAEARGDEWLKSMSGFTIDQFKKSTENGLKADGLFIASQATRGAHGANR